MRVLLAEDAVATQDIVRHLLSARGHDVTIALNGQEAVRLFCAEPFEMVLMDLQMPVMDGLLATDAIRGWEAARQSRVPIVAITACATLADRQRCLAVGMDAFLGKPIHIQTLVEMVERFDPSLHRSASAEAHLSAATNGDSQPFDFSAALARMGNDRILFESIMDIFFEDYPQLIERIRQGLRDEDASAARIAAHSLKGLTSQFSTDGPARIAGRIELAAKDRDLATVQNTVDSLEQETFRLRDALLALEPA